MSAMRPFLAGFACAYLLAALYFGAILTASDAIRPRGAAPIAALIWPVTMARAFTFQPEPSR